MRLGFWDLETMHAPPTYNGKEDWRGYTQNCGMSVAVLYDTGDKMWHFYSAQDREGHDAWALAERLEQLDYAVGHNSQTFDERVVSAIVKRKLRVNHIDMLRTCWNAAGGNQTEHGPFGLDAVCERTLGLHKDGESAMAPTLAQQGRWGRLFQYCLHDVLLVKSLYEFVVRHKYVIDSKGHKLEIPGLHRRMAEEVAA